MIAVVIIITLMMMIMIMLIVRRESPRTRGIPVLSPCVVVSESESVIQN